MLRGDDLAAQVLNGLLARHDLDPAEIEDVQMGCVTQIGEQGWNVGRMAVLAAGWPVTVSATTVDRQCGSSMQTNFNAATAVMAGQLDLVVSAGVEMMSRVPMGSNGGSISERVTERYEIVMQGTSAELLADEWKLSREALDAYSLESHRRALAASDGGRFDARDHPDRAAGRARLSFAVDEAPRRETSAEALAALKPAFRPDGVVTAGNSSQIVDGVGRRADRERGGRPAARARAAGALRVLRDRRGRSDADAARQSRRRWSAPSAKAGLTLDDMAVIEVNEAFASVVLQTAQDLHLEERMDDVNPNGGGISLGHPLGATGARITATLLSELERRDARYGIASMCVGFGMAIAGVVERL